MLDKEATQETITSSCQRTIVVAPVNVPYRMTITFFKSGLLSYTFTKVTLSATLGEL